MSDALKRAQAKYDAAHTKQIRLKLNKVTDADILQRLDQVDNKQGYIKALIRADKHGYWKHTPTYWYYCSVCGCEPPNETNIKTLYCPNCGAKMDL